jgi:hypothetical protein
MLKLIKNGRLGPPRMSRGVLLPWKPMKTVFVHDLSFQASDDDLQSLLNSTELCGVQGSSQTGLWDGREVLPSSQCQTAARRKVPSPAQRPQRNWIDGL